MNCTYTALIILCIITFFIGLISCESLYNLLTSVPDQCMVIDCRSRGDFMTSHVDTKRYPQWLCIPQEAIKNG